MMNKKVFLILMAVLLVNGSVVLAEDGGCFGTVYGELMEGSIESVGLWWTSSGYKVARRMELPIKKGNSVVVRAGRNETEAVQLVVQPGYSLHNFTAEAGQLIGPNGAVIFSENIDILRVRYVETIKPSDDSSQPGFWPDPLVPLEEPVNLQSGINHPFWIRVKVPKDTPAGIYKGIITLNAKHYNAAVSLQVEVYDFTMPDRMTCTLNTNIYTDMVFRYHNIKKPEQKRQIMDKYWQVYKDYHLAPYDPAPFDPIEVTWPEVTETTKPEELIPVFDWSKWDKAVEKGIEDYKFNAFKIVIPGLRGESPELLGFKEGTDHYKAAFTNYCKAFQEHLREKGWLDKAYLYWIDEPTPDEYEYTVHGFNKVENAAPDIRRMLTRAPCEGLIGGPNLWCSPTHHYDDKVALERKKLGEHFWWYLCSNPKAPYATLYLDHPGTEFRVWLWQSWKREIEGLLIWAVNYWDSSLNYPAWDKRRAYPDPNHPQNPYQDTMSWRAGNNREDPWGNGDGRLLYPPLEAAAGLLDEVCMKPPIASMRLEMIRDGIEDYEYFTILKKKIEEKKNKLLPVEIEKYKNLLKVPDSVSKDMKHFAIDPAPMEAHRDKLARAIAALNKL